MPFLFQSLLSWKYNQITNISDPEEAAALMFQSLLSWKYNQIMPHLRVVVVGFHSFNPCYLGNTIRSLHVIEKIASKIRIRFNPCYLGNTIRSQSCLYNGSTGLSMFQSLLSWKYNQICLSAGLYPLSASLCFNPCYLGNTIRSELWYWFEYQPHHHVSILVILEIQSDRGLRVQKGGGWRVSILVILEIQSDQYLTGKGCESIRVSILVILEIQSDQPFENQFIRLTIVSILVILEIQSDLGNGFLKTNKTICFNPCYLGNTIRSSMTSFNFFFASSFNPCYLGNTIRSP